MVVRGSPTGRAPRFARRSLLAAPGALAIAALPGVSLARRQPAADDVLVRGEAPTPAAGSVAWRVVQDVAEQTPAAAFERRSLGFAVNTAPFDAILVTDEATGTAFRLSPGEAVFTPDGVSQRRESPGPDPVAYLRIALVAAASAEDAGGDRLRFAGPAFDLPGGPHAFGLRRVALEPGDAIDLSPEAGHALVLVEQGEVTLDSGAGSEVLATTVGSDAAYAIRSVAGAARLVGERAATTVLVAEIV